MCTRAFLPERRRVPSTEPARPSHAGRSPARREYRRGRQAGGRVDCDLLPGTAAGAGCRGRDPGEGVGGRAGA
jgi:hypothetical protein